MDYKICKTCGMQKEITCFRKCVNYYRGDCYECEKKKNKLYRIKNKEKLSIKYKEYRNAHLEYIKQKNKEYNELNKEKRKEYNQKYYNENKKYYSQKHKEYTQKNFDKIQKNRKKWEENNKEKVKTYRQKDYLKRKNDPLLLFKDNIRKNIGNSFRKKKLKKNKKTEEILGCKTDFFINYLIETYEKNYNEKWNWEYLKKVHIDHIKPLAIAKNEEEVINLCHYTNLQLLKSEDNLQKNNRLDWKLT